VYIQRQTAETASGGAGRGISGRRGGETESEAKWSEFQAEFVVNNAIISYHAVQVDHDNKVLIAAGMDIDAQGVIIYAEDNVNQIGSKFKATADAITQEVTDRSNADATLTSSIQQEANKISLIVQNVGANGTVTAASIVTAIDNDSSGVTITADHIQITGNTGILGALTVQGVLTATGVQTNGITVHSLTIDNGGANLGNANVYYNGYGLGSVVRSFGTPTESSGQISIPYYTMSGDTPSYINFNIAATQYFQDEMAAAELRGWNAACDMVTKVGNTIYGPQKNSYGNYEQKYSANYTSSSYSASTHSHSDAWMKIDGITGTYWNDAIVTLNSFSGNVQFNSGFDSYYPSSYSPSSFSWTTY
jgi:hypothetical protein